MAETRQYLTFGIERECFALPVERVREILDMGPISRLPNAPPYVLGLTDVRGAGLLILDLRRKFGFAAAAATNRTRIIVVDATLDGERLGFGLVADFGAAGALVLGPACELKDVKRYDTAPVRLSFGGEPAATGSAEVIDGGAMGPIRIFLRQALAAGHALQKGQAIVTGSCTGYVKAPAGEEVVAAFDALGASVRLTFVPSA